MYFLYRKQQFWKVSQDQKEIGQNVKHNKQFNADFF